MLPQLVAFVNMQQKQFKIKNFLKLLGEPAVRPEAVGAAITAFQKVEQH